MARTTAPRWFGPFVRLPWQGIAPWLLLVVAFTVQFALLWMAGQLLDLFVAACQLWLELARKHLEITL